MPLYSSSSLFRGPKNEWDTNFARRYLKIPDDEMEFLNSLHVGGSASQDETTKKQISENQRNLPTPEENLHITKPTNPVITPDESITLIPNSNSTAALPSTSDPIVVKSTIPQTTSIVNAHEKSLDLIPNSNATATLSHTSDPIVVKSTIPQTTSIVNAHEESLNLIPNSNATATLSHTSDPLLVKSTTPQTTSIVNAHEESLNLIPNSNATATLSHTSDPLLVKSTTPQTTSIVNAHEESLNLIPNSNATATLSHTSDPLLVKSTTPQTTSIVNAHEESLNLIPNSNATATLSHTSDPLLVKSTTPQTTSIGNAHEESLNLIPNSNATASLPHTFDPLLVESTVLQTTNVVNAADATVPNCNSIATLSYTSDPIVVKSTIPRTTSIVNAPDESLTSIPNSNATASLAHASDPLPVNSTISPSKDKSRNSLSSYFSKIVGVFSRQPRRRSSSDSDLSIPNAKESSSFGKSANSLVEIPRNMSGDQNCLFIPDKGLIEENEKCSSTFENEKSNVQTIDEQSSKTISPVKLSLEKFGGGILKHPNLEDLSSPIENNRQSPEKISLNREHLLSNKLQLLEKRLCPSEEHDLQSFEKNSKNDGELEIIRSRKQTPIITETVSNTEASVCFPDNKEHSSENIVSNVMTDASSPASFFAGVQNVEISETKQKAFCSREIQVEEAVVKSAPIVSGATNCLSKTHDPVIIHLKQSNDIPSSNLLSNSQLNSLNQPETEIKDLESSTTPSSVMPSILDRGSSANMNLVTQPETGSTLMAKNVDSSVPSGIPQSTEEHSTSVVSVPSEISQSTEQHSSSAVSVPSGIPQSIEEHSSSAVSVPSEIPQSTEEHSSSAVSGPSGIPQSTEEHSSSVPNSTNLLEKKSPTKSQDLEGYLSSIRFRVASSDACSSSQPNLLNEPEIKSPTKSTNGRLLHTPKKSKKFKSDSSASLSFGMSSTSDMCSSQPNLLNKPEIKSPAKSIDVRFLHTSKQSKKFKSDSSASLSFGMSSTADMCSSALPNSLDQPEISHQKSDNFMPQPRIQVQKWENSLNQLETQFQKFDNSMNQLENLSQQSNDVEGSQLHKVLPAKHTASQNSAMLPLTDTDSLIHSDSLNQPKIKLNTKSDNADSGATVNKGENVCARFSVFSQSPYSQVNLQNSSASCELVKESGKRKRLSKEDQRPRKKISLSNSCVNIKYTPTQIMSMIDIMKRLQSGM